VTQPAQSIELENLDEQPASVEPRHSFIRPTSASPGSDSVPAFLVREGVEPMMLPRLMAWSSLGLLVYAALEAGSSTYHLVRDARVRPLAASHIRAELHGLLDEVAHRRPGVVLPGDAASSDGQGQSRGTQDQPASTTSHAPALAFVPHSHVPLIKANATVYECRLWSMFACEPVGHVIEILPGEVEVAGSDTSGGSARGQYAVMQLTDPHAVEAESLRVRDPLETALYPATTEEAGAETLL